MFDHVPIGVADIALSKKAPDRTAGVDARGANAREEMAVVAAIAPHARPFAILGTQHGDGVRFRRADFHRP